jgi:SAM-dependent methyltransferase
VEFRAGNVNDWTEPGAYDFVYCRFLLQHLNRPAGLLARMWEAVRPGGAIAVEDTDYEGLFCDPPNDGVEFHKRMYPQLVEQNGGDALIGRKLYRYFLQAGIPDPGLHVAQGADAKGEAKTVILMTLRATADSLVRAGLASADEVAAAIESLAAFTAAPDTIVSGARIFQVWARR